LGKNKDVKYEMPAPITVENINKFMDDYKAGRLTKYIKSETDDSVAPGLFRKKLTGNTFPKMLQSDK
jgi:hypothetical protein